MGLMDKAKKLAEQAQTKLDEAQKQFNERQAGSSGTQPEPAPPPAEAATPPHGDPVAPREPSDQEEDRNRPSYEPPKRTGGDPLAG
jgi:hypothetical protein